MSNKLYVGSLSYSIDDKGLEAIFVSVGPVLSAKVIVDRDTGRSKGFGFVEMESKQGADDAIKTLNGTTHEGRAIAVSEARPQTTRSGGGGGRGGDRGDRGGRGGWR